MVGSFVTHGNENSTLMEPDENSKHLTANVKVGEDIVQAVWEKARIIPEVSPDRWRKDQNGAWIGRDKFNDSSLPLSFGWKLSYILPPEDGGPDEPENLKPLQWENAEATRRNAQRNVVTSDGYHNTYFANLKRFPSE